MNIISTIRHTTLCLGTFVHQFSPSRYESILGDVIDFISTRSTNAALWLNVNGRLILGDFAEVSYLSKILDESILIGYLFCIGYMAGRADLDEQQKSLYVAL